jgi:hypothetical protein
LYHYAWVVGLGALNKNEALNGGGQLFVDKHPELKVRVVHGNTLTAAAILQKLPSGVKEIFLTGATSKLGRAICLYLSARGVKVVMYTTSDDRFNKIRDEADAKHRWGPLKLNSVYPCHRGGRGLEPWWRHSFVAF